MRRSVLAEHAQHPNEWPTDTSLNTFRQVGGSAIHNIVGNHEGYLGPVNPITGLRSRLLQGKNISLCGRGDPQGTPAQKRAHQLIEIHNEYDFGVVIHGVNSLAESSVWYSPRAPMLVRSVAALVSKKVIIAPHYTPLHYTPRSFNAELARGGTSLEEVCELLVEVANGYTPPPVVGLEEYAYVGDVTAEQGRHLGLRDRYEGFEPLSDADQEALRGIGFTQGQFYAGGWDASHEPQTGYRGELLVRYDLIAAKLEPKVASLV
jgi:hypothetical protein